MNGSHADYDLPPGANLPGLNLKNRKFETAFSIWKKLPAKLSNLIRSRAVRN